MITKKQVTIYVSDAGNSGPKKYHSLWGACMRESFHRLMRHYRKTMTELEFENYRQSVEFEAERKNVARVVREEYRKGQEVAA